MFQWLLNFPRALEKTYDISTSLIRPFKRWLNPGGLIEPVFVAIEGVGKGAVFNCQMCGQCILHSTGMTCPMTCPKNLRNGPCGGVRLNGNCEVKPDMPCVWVLAYERASKMPKYGHKFVAIQPPLNNRLAGSSAWINMLHGIDVDLPRGWLAERVEKEEREEDANAE